MRGIATLTTICGLGLALTGCAGLTSGKGDGAGPKIETSEFGKTPDGRPVTAWTVTNAKGMKMKLIDWGAINVSLEVPDRAGKLQDVILGVDSPMAYNASPYFGAVVGRYGNRIAKGQFTLDGKTYQLATNNGPNHLHGGNVGFNKTLWKGEEVRSDEGAGVKFTLVSPDGDEGYPGTLTCSVTYLLNDKNEVSFTYDATTDKPTVLNITQHNYYNLAGQGEGDILGHELTLNADNYTPVDATLITTGEIATVKGTPLDFTTATAIGARIAQVPGGYDHNFVLNGKGGEMRPAATVYEPKSGRVMEILTTEPGIQFYTGNFLDGTVTGKGGKVYNKNYGFCLETQHFPDSPNKPKFPSVVLRPGEHYSHKTVERFSTK